MQRFVFLALKLAHQGDDEVQYEERAALTDSARRIGETAGIAEAETDAMVRDAIDAFQEARKDGMLAQLVDDSVEALGTFASEIRNVLVHELRKVAMAADGVNRDEHVWLDDLRARWGVDILAR